MTITGIIAEFNPFHNGHQYLLEQAGFKSFKLYADFEDKEPTETSTRWFFVAQK